MITPGEKRTDGFGNFYVYDHQEKGLVFVYDRLNKLVAVKPSEWERWSVVTKAEQEGLFS